MMGYETFNVSVVGYGLSAKVFHIPFIELTKGLRLHSIIQRSPRAGDSAPDDHPALKHFGTVDAMLQDADIDLVVVTTPQNTHFDIARQILEGGKHVVVEKPFVPTSAQAEELARIAREKNKLLCVYQNRRWDADFLTVQRLLRAKKLGDIYEFETHFGRFRPEEPKKGKAKWTLDDGVGVIYDLGTHLIDQVFVLFGRPTGVYGKFAQQRTGKLVSGDGGPEEQADSANIMLTYADKGLIVHVRISVMSVAEGQPRFWIRGTEGSYRKEGLDPQEAQLVSGMRISDRRFGVDGAAYNGRLELLREDGSIRSFTVPNVEPQTYLRFYELLAKALSTGKKGDVPVPPTEAAEVLKIIEAIRESARSGKEEAVA